MKRVVLALALVLALGAPSLARGPYRFYGGGYRYYSAPVAPVYGGTGAFMMPGVYQPWSTSIYPTAYGANYLYQGGVVGPGFYMPYSFAVPAYPAVGFGVY